jgi:DNA mismatch repair ATPase MutS
VKQAIAGIENKARDLMEIATVLHGIENEHFNSSHLQSLQSRIRIGSAIPSERVAQLARLVDLLNNRRNPFFAPVGVLVCWTTRLAISIDSWRARVGPTIKVWESAIGEVEALLSLAAYSFENPNDPFPEIVDHGLVVESTGLGHPLISTSHCVPNDIQLGDRPRLLLVSGSNMSGKSTLLRSVGVNVVLALAGAPVRAKSMRLSPVVVGATLRVQDSLQAGVSRFFAEITRIRQLVELTKHSPPLLFLFDELLHGTNSHDRVIGAGAILRSLVESGAIGLATTHDLALTALVEELGDRAKNVHFADELIDGRLVFDYRMRPGVVRHSNALDLMRAVGLEL